MARFTLNTELTLDHHAAHTGPIVERTLDKHYRATSIFMRGWVTWFAFAVVLALFGHRAWQIYGEWMIHGHPFIWIGDWILAALVGYFAFTLIRARGRPDRLIKSSVNRLVSFDGVNVGPMTVTADEGGLIVEHTKRKTAYKWAAFEALNTSGEALALHLSSVMVVLLPFSAFKDDAERQAFEAFARSQIEAARLSPR